VPRSPDLNGQQAEGVDFIQVSQRRGLRSSTAVAYLSPPPEGLEIIDRAEVLRIVVENGRAAGVTLRRGGIERTIRARDGVVVSAGALNTPRLLMLSGIGPAKHLTEHGIAVVADLPGVGGNLQEHPAVHLVNEVSAHTLNLDAKGFAGLLQVLKLAFAGSGALTTGIGHAQAFVKTRKGLPVPNIQLAFSAFAFDITPQGNLALRPQSSISTLAGLMRPSSRGRISLRSPDPADKPKIEHQLLGSDDDAAQLVEGLQIARKIVAQPALAPYVTSEVRPGAAAGNKAALTGYVRAATIPMFHPVGTAKMGAASDKQAVVGPDLKVHGIERLWVADASVMPTIPQGNTNATSIMIGEKASDLVLAALG
jgi:choline dehydrogenase